MSKVWPGERLKYTEDCLEGHGIYKEKQEDSSEIFIASVHGEVKQVDRLISVETDTYWYNPCIGDVVVGKVTAIANKRWCLDINTRPEAVLLLNSIDLVGNVQRRKGELDEIKMGEYYGVGDIVIGEVQAVGNKVQIHTRNPKYRKILFGVLLKTEKPQKSMKQHHQETVNGKEVEVVVGKNGYIVVHSDDTTSHLEIKEVASRILGYVVEQAS